MAKVLIVYYSKTGNTKKMTERIGKGASGAGAAVLIKFVGGYEI